MFLSCNVSEIWRVIGRKSALTYPTWCIWHPCCAGWSHSSFTGIIGVRRREPVSHCNCCLLDRAISEVSKLGKQCIAVSINLALQRYGKLTCHMGSHSVTCHPAMVKIPPLSPTKVGTRFSDPWGIQGWVDLGYVKTDQPGIESATCKSQVQRPTVKPISHFWRSTGLGQTERQTDRHTDLGSQPRFRGACGISKVFGWLLGIISLHLEFSSAA